MKIKESYTIDGVMEGPGLHLVAYYCSLEHLLLKGAMFLKQGLETGEKCYYSIAPEHHTYLEEILAGCGVDVTSAKARGQLNPLHFDELYDHYRVDGVQGLTGYFKELWNTGLQESFSGVRMISDTKYGIMHADSEHYLQWEKDLDSVLMRIPIVNLCLYDIENLLTKDCATSSRIINKTMDCHKYFLNENKIMNAEYFKKKGA